MSLMPDENEGSAAPRQDSRDATEDSEDERDKAGAAVAEPDTGRPSDDGSSSRMLEYLEEARKEGKAKEKEKEYEGGGGGEEDGEEMTGFPANGSAFRRFKAVDEALDEADALLLSDSARAPSSAGSFSNPDDSPSLHVRSRCLFFRFLRSQPLSPQHHCLQQLLFRVLSLRLRLLGVPSDRAFLPLRP